MKGKKLNKKAAVTLAVGIMVVMLYFMWGIAEERYDGEGATLHKIVYIPKSDANGNDAVLIFNYSGQLNYLVLNKYKAGFILELEHKVGKEVKVHYKYMPNQDLNVGIDYQVIN